MPGYVVHAEAGNHPQEVWGSGVCACFPYNLIVGMEAAGHLVDA